VSLLDRLRRDRPPADALRGLAAGDRVLTWAVYADAQILVATRLGLRLSEDRMLAWHRIDKAVWRDDMLALTESVEVEPGVIEDQRPILLSLSRPRDLPEVVRSRVTHSVAYTNHHALPGGGGMRVVARRVPGHDGLSWAVRYDPGTDRNDPRVREAGEALLAQARSALTAGE